MKQEWWPRKTLFNTGKQTSDRAFCALDLENSFADSELSWLASNAAQNLGGERVEAENFGTVVTIFLYK